MLGLTLPVTSEDLDRTRRVLLYTWNPARYSNLTNNAKKYMESYKKAEEMTKLIEAAYALLSCRARSRRGMERSASLLNRLIQLRG